MVTPDGLLSPTSLSEIRARFPVLHQQVNNRPLVYLDNAATTQKPESVIHELARHYREDNANIHRGIHTLAERATREFEATRKALAGFLNAEDTDEVILTKGVTEGINLVASGFGRSVLREGDEIVLSGMEHHSNIVPWQMAAEAAGASLKVIPVQDDGTLDLDAFRRLLDSGKVRIVAFNHASNSLGTINPVKEMVRLSHEKGAAVLVDGAQAVSHLTVDVRDLDCDFYAASAHKMYGPTGVGVLYGKRSWLEKLPPYQGGGEMIRDVTFERTTYNDIPYKFEAGTPPIAGIVAWKKAIEFVDEIGKPVIAAHERSLLEHARRLIAGLPGIRFIGTAAEKVSVLAFVIDGFHHFDVGQLLDARGIAVRTGHHCTQPLMQRFGIEGTIRASFAVYNTMEETEALAQALESIISRQKGRS